MSKGARKPSGEPRRARAPGARLLAGALGALALGGGAQASEARSQTLLEPPGGRVYHAAYPEFRGSEDHVRSAYVRRYQRLAGKRIAWAYFSNNWTRGIAFPRSAVDRIHAAGSVPFIRLMARSDFDQGGPDERYTLERLIAGEYDAALREWGRAAAAVPYPLLVEFGTEMNGFWFPWNARWNGAGETAGYGDPALADGPERFRDAYRHVRDAIEAEGAENLTWFWHANASGYPRKPWNSIASYWPGDAYVDWIGVSAYGPLTLSDGWGKGFPAMLDGAYPKLAALSATDPIAVLEYGARQGRPKARWIAAAMRAVARGRWPRVRALAYWHERWRNDDGSVSNLHIDSDRGALRAYRRGVARRAFTGTAAFGP